MPFTFAHPAIVLPLDNLKTRRFSLTGLITGALVPDFEYFIRMRIYSIYSHTICGLFWFDIPLGILLAFLFHNIVRNELFDNLPPVLSERLLTYKTFNWNNYFKKHWLVVLYSVFIGAVSHLFLDAFTHPAGYFVNLLPGVFNQTIIADIPLYKILQHSFTLISTLYIIYYFLKMPAIHHTNLPTSKYWIQAGSSATIIIALRFWIIPDYRLVANVVVSVISAFLSAIMIASLFFKTAVSN
ncbi:DUF4184 family protein [Mucilaginibacter sp. SMC90]|uniref:DUF4184 family protein n=1 Tax=Mucilaginibacter sp. SMC90 TaxID=2929803 RepID=UPI001FB25222|nr:DUF4184 family protein [Mucilaginibacter sp. SMC90]UOE51753.1 DUF4184 family protein [Mucilaginibacter sp. SMC90]